MGTPYFKFRSKFQPRVPSSALQVPFQVPLQVPFQVPLLTTFSFSLLTRFVQRPSSTTPYERYAN